LLTFKEKDSWKSFFIIIFLWNAKIFCDYRRIFSYIIEMKNISY
jgi:hypothetical protein